MHKDLNKTIEALQNKALIEIEKIKNASWINNGQTSEIKWTISEDSGKIKIIKEANIKKNEIAPTMDLNENSLQVNSLSNNIKNKAVLQSAPNMPNILGIKVKLDSRVETYKNSFRKNYILSRSHNILVASFAKMKTGFYGGILSFLGVSHDEIEEIKRKSKESEISQKKKLFEENEYTAILLSVIGGPRGQLKGQKSITDEIRNQTIKQCVNWGLAGYYTKNKIIEIQMEQYKKILEKFEEERTFIIYQLSMFDSGISFSGEVSNREEISAKLAKIEKYIMKAKRLLEMHERSFETLKNKEKRSIDDLIAGNPTQGGGEMQSFLT